MNKKKYILKPGRHQFAPAGGTGHHNGAMTDEEAEWYLQHYPHIAELFTPQPFKDESTEVQTDKKTKRIKPLKPDTGGKGDA